MAYVRTTDSNKDGTTTHGTCCTLNVKGIMIFKEKTEKERRDSFFSLENIK
jgi:hypothetical protein